MKIIVIGVVCFLLAQAQQDIRIDTFDKKSNRTGYIIINPNTGRLDQFDSRSNRLGYGQVTGSGSNQRIDTYSTNGSRSNSTLTTPRR
jgi:hypothetical protein